MLTYDDHLLLSAMDANGLSPNVDNQSTGFDPNDMLSPIYSLPSASQPPSAPPIDLPSPAPGTDASSRQQSSNSGAPYSPVGTGSAPPPNPVLPGPTATPVPVSDTSNGTASAYGFPTTSSEQSMPNIAAQLDNSDLGVGQWPGMAAYAQGSQLIGMGLGPAQGAFGFPTTAPGQPAPNIAAQLDNSDLGVGQWPGSASYNQGGQIIGLGTSPNLLGLPPAILNRVNAGYDAAAKRGATAPPATLPATPPPSGQSPSSGSVRSSQSEARLVEGPASPPEIRSLHIA